MSWLGKFVGGTFGFFVGGPLGAVLGAAVGHQFDRGVGKLNLLSVDFAPGAKHRVQMAFFTATFSVMGHVAKADGRVSEAEIAAARDIMNRMDLSEDLRKTAINLFNEGKQPSFPLDEALTQFRDVCQRRQSLMRMFVEIQTEAAFADGGLHDAAEELLLRICDRLHFSRFEFRALKARMEAERRFADASAQARQQRSRRDSPLSREPSLTDAYAILGLTPRASEGEVKKAYRKLMSQNHPDKLVASGLPDEMVKLANEKTQQIRRAYDTISNARRF